MSINSILHDLSTISSQYFAINNTSSKLEVFRIECLISKTWAHVTKKFDTVVIMGKGLDINTFKDTHFSLGPAQPLSLPSATWLVQPTNIV